MASSPDHKRAVTVLRTSTPVRRLSALMNHSTPFPLLRTYLSWTYRKSRPFLFSYSLGVAGIVIAIIGGSVQSILPIVLGIAIAIVGVLGATVTWYRSVKDLQLRRLDDDGRALTVSDRLVNSGYKVEPREGHPSHGLLTSEEINKALFSSAQSPGLIVADRKTYHAEHSGAVAQVLLKAGRPQPGVVFFNAKKVRIVSEPLLDNSGALTPVYIQPTRYFDTVITNNALPFALRSKRGHRDVFNGHENCFPDYTISECSDDSFCANQVGASTLAVTSDSYLVITEQGSKSAQGPGELAPSGSGSADWRRDTRGRADLRAFVKDFAGRELEEECGLKHEDIEWLKIIGYGRLLHRAGLPQFFCFAKLKCEYRNIEVTPQEQGLTNRHLKVDCGRNPLRGDTIRDKFNEFASTGTAGSITPSLWGNLYLLPDILEEHP